MDKASVLGDAVKHIKYLQETVKEYEEQKKERTMESMVLVKKSQLVLDDNNQSLVSSSDGNHDYSGSNLPEIEVRVSGKDLLIKILCEKQKGHVIKIMGDIEKLGLSITNSSVLPFGPTFDISIIAQVTIYVLIQTSITFISYICFGGYMILLLETMNRFYRSCMI